MKKSSLLDCFHSNNNKTILLLNYKKMKTYLNYFKKYTLFKYQVDCSFFQPNTKNMQQGLKQKKTLIDCYYCSNETKRE